MCDSCIHGYLLGAVMALTVIVCWDAIRLRKLEVDVRYLEEERRERKESPSRIGLEDRLR